MFRIELKGMRELEINLRGLRGFVNSDEIENALLSGAQTIKRQIKGRAPRGPTGNLRSAIVAKKFKNKIKNAPAVFVAIRGRSRGPGAHAHLVEYGTMASRTPKRKRVMRFIIDGQEIFATSVAPMPAKPFWKPGVLASQNAAGNKAAKKIGREIERAAATKKLRRYATLV